MKKRKLTFTAAAVSSLLIISLLSGCSKIKSLSSQIGKNKTVSETSAGTDFSSDESLPKSERADKPTASNDNNATVTPNTGATPTAAAPTGTPAAVPKATAVPAPTVKPVTNTSSSPVNQVTAKPAATVQAPTAPAVQVSDTDAFSNLVVSDVVQGKDVVVTLNNTITKDNVADKALKAVEEAGYSGYISGLEYSISNNVATIHFSYKGGKDLFLSKISAVNSKVQEIVSSVIKSGMSEFSKELALHDYLVNHAAYDYKNLESNTIPDDSYTAYGALIKGTAVCQGYAEAMYRLLNKTGVKTLIITGLGNNVPHAWNLVNIGGAYYQLDSTFDDPVSSSGNILSYDYFNVTDAQMSKDHSWTQANYPKCTSTAANYFVASGLVANNKTEFYNIVKKGLQNKQSVIRCKTATYDTTIYPPSIISDILRDNPDINYVNTKNGYSYSYDQNTFVMEFYITYK